MLGVIARDKMIYIYENRNGNYELIFLFLFSLSMIIEWFIIVSNQLLGRLTCQYQNSSYENVNSSAC